MPRGFYLALEGPSRSGKTTQRDKLVTYWKQRYGRSPLVTREPGAGPGQSQIADKIRDFAQGQVSQSFVEDMGPWTEACLYAASRAQTLRQVVYPALYQRVDVIADRSFVSSLAFQGCGRGLGIGPVFRLNALALYGEPVEIPHMDWKRVVGSEIASSIYHNLVIQPSPESLDPVCERLLYMACESQVTGSLPPFSSLEMEAYRIPEDMLMVPDLILHLDISPEGVFRRELDLKGDKFEGLNQAFHGKVQQAYHQIRRSLTTSEWVTVNGDAPKDEVFQRIIDALEPHLPQS